MVSSAKGRINRAYKKVPENNSQLLMPKVTNKAEDRRKRQQPVQLVQMSNMAFRRIVLKPLSQFAFDWQQLYIRTSVALSELHKYTLTSMNHHRLTSKA